MFDVIPDELKALHRYYIRASAVREDMLRVMSETKTDDDGRVGMLDLMQSDQRMSVFYGLVFVIVEGFRELQLQDPKIDALLASPLLSKLRRYRNAIFHFQKDWFVSEKHMDFFADLDAPAWIHSLWKELNRYFSNALVRPVFAAVQADGDD